MTLSRFLATAVASIALSASAQTAAPASATPAMTPAAPPPATAPATPSATAPAAAKADVAKGGAISTAVCAACHTADGSRGSAANPIIAGQHPDYLVKQLAEYKSGKRRNPIMQGFAATLGTGDMINVAAFYAGKQARPGFAKSKELASLGEKIWRGGIAERSVPACSGCHGPNGAGIPAQYPRLAAQHADYLDAQMVAFRDGSRANNAVMTGVAARMNDREIRAVADYAAGLR